LYAPRAADSELERARTRARSARGPNRRARAGAPARGRPPRASELATSAARF